MLFTIPGYQIIEELHHGLKTVVYRGVKEVEQQPVIIKLLKNAFPTLEDITRLRQEYKLLQNLTSEGIVKPLSLENYHDRLALILEDFGGESLNKFVSNKKLQLIDFLRIAIELTAALGHLHQNQIIHKDIKPSNIIINPETLKVKITDFSIATRLSREDPTISNPNFLEGTLPYMSPEQTGRMNRAIDYRTDFYSLGITFYELLTGSVPFNATDPIEFVHCHIAKQPLPPREANPEIPQAVSDIVIKLLAKTAEDRYQSAQGLKFDLETCLFQLQTTSQIADFPVGKRDRRSQFLIPQKLYGREAEVATLMGTFDRVSQGSSEMMLVSGYSGIGKSALVNEIHKPIVRQRGYFIAGKFDQFQRNIPYGSLIQAFQSLMRQLLTETEEKIDSWRAKLLEALGQNGQVIIDVIPEVELIIGQQQTLPHLGPTESQNRFNLVFQQFIHVFTKPEHPLVLFLDDLQWADSASLKLIQLLLCNPDSQYLLMIGAYRDNEVSATHPLMQILEEIQAYGVTVNNITLRPLDISNVSQLVADTLNESCSSTIEGNEGNEADKSKELAELVLQKTDGNPFFLNQLLKSLYEEKLIDFDSSSDCWHWDIKKIQEVGITDNVVELMTGKIKKLALDTQNVLKLAACIGNIFNLKTLSIVNEKFPIKTANELWQAVQEGLILPIDKNYSFFQYYDQEAAEIFEDDLVISYKFLHDRVQQAAYSLISDEQKKELHYQIGKLLLKNTQKEKLEEKIFDIVNQLNVGVELIYDPQEKAELAHLNLIAGKKAKASTAYNSALKYFTSGTEFLPETRWEDYYELSFELHKEMAECEYLTGQLSLAEDLFNFTLTHTKSKFDIANIYSIQTALYQTQGNFEKGIITGLEGLKVMELNIPSTEDKLPTAIAVELEEVQSTLSKIKIADLLDMPEMTDLGKRVCMNLLVNLWGASLGAAAHNLLVMCVLKMVNISLKYGNANTSSFAYSVYGLLLAVQEDYQTAYEFGNLSLKLNEKFNDASLIGKVYNLFCHALNPYINHFKTNLPIYKKSYQHCMEGGDLIYGVWALFFTIWTRFEIGDNLKEVSEEAEKYLSSVQQINDRNMLYAFMTLQRTLWSLEGKTEDKYILNDKLFNEKQCLNQWVESNFSYGSNWYFYLKTQLLYTYENYSDAIQICKNADRTVAYNFGFYPLTKHYFYYSLNITALYPSVTDAEKREFWQTLELNQEKMKKWADNCPENYLHKYLLVAAEIARISGQELDAMDLYRQAIKSARLNGFIQNEALGNELAAKFYLAKGWDEIAQTYMREARYGYAKWGARGKVKDLDEKYPQILSITSDQAINSALEGTQTSTFTYSSSTYSSSGVLDLSTVMKASQALSSEMVLDQLLDKVMKIVIENAGAQTGFLILAKNGELLIVAVGSVKQENATVLQSTPVATSQHLPVSVINYVARTQQNIVLNDATSDNLFAYDPYITQKQPKSVLCAPLINQGKLIGILYLENNLTTGAFTPARIEVLKLLTSQAAISLENAMLYEQLQEYSRNLEVRVEERTRELKANNLLLQQEIKERQLAEAALRESEEKFSTAFRSSPDSIIITSFTDGRYIEVNDSFLTFSGYQREEVIGHTASELNIWATPECRPKITHMLQEQGAVRDQEFNIRIKSGEIKTMLISAEVIDIGGQACILSVGKDITSRKQAEEALRTAEAKYHTIFDNVTEGIFQSTPDGRYLSVNPALARIYGYSSPQELVQSLTDIAPQLYVDPNRRREFMAAIEKSDSISNFESQVYRADGSIIWISENVRAVRDDNRTLLYYEGTVSDITERKVVAEALSFQKEQSENLLLSIFPKAIAERLKQQQGAIADSFEEVTVLFADIVGFTQLSANISPTQLVNLLNQIFSTFDHLTERHRLEKIKTIGDAYMVVGGLPLPRTDHAEAIADMALDMQQAIASFNANTNGSLSIRIGINTGTVVAGVIGIKKFIYDLWGDTVNTASRMESQGLPGRIQVTGATYERLRDKYVFQERGIIDVKGKGNMMTYFLTGRKAQ